MKNMIILISHPEKNMNKIIILISIMKNIH